MKNMQSKTLGVSCPGSPAARPHSGKDCLIIVINKSQEHLSISHTVTSQDVYICVLFSWCMSLMVCCQWTQRPSGSCSLCCMFCSIFCAPPCPNLGDWTYQLLLINVKRTRYLRRSRAWARERFLLSRAWVCWDVASPRVMLWVC